MRHKYITQFVILILAFTLVKCVRDKRQYTTQTKQQINRQMLFRPVSFAKNECCVFLLNHNELYVVKKGEYNWHYDTSNCLYICNSSILKDKIENLRGDSVSYMLKCGYNYDIIFTQKDSISQTASLNTKCGFAYTDNGAFQFDTFEFNNFVKGMSKLRIKRFFAKNIQNARNLWRQNAYANTVVLQAETKPEWIDYDGYFYIDNSKGYIDENEKKKLTILFKTKYPNENFEFDKYSDRINSSKTFYDKFSLYKKNQWNDFEKFNFELLYR